MSFDVNDWWRFLVTEFPVEAIYKGLENFFGKRSNLFGATVDPSMGPSYSPPSGRRLRCLEEIEFEIDKAPEIEIQTEFKLEIEIKF